MTPNKSLKGVRGGRQQPAGRVFNGSEGHDSGAGLGRVYASLQEALAGIAREERCWARARQKEAGIARPIRTYFKGTGKAALDAALSTIWAAGLESKKLYVKIGKGLACLTEEDVLAIGRLGAVEIEALASAALKELTSLEGEKS